jgi:diguanylate cyclase (GGDEF)-like protein
MDDLSSLLRLTLNSKTPEAFLFCEKILEQHAKITDAGINDSLLKQLILDYATTERKLSTAMTELAEANKRLTLLSTQDGLTGLYNRRHFDAHFEAEWRRGLRDKTPISIIMADIDHFKLYNDHYGHQGGDDCLRQVAAAIGKASHRPTDLAARYGGEEFVLVLAETLLDGAVQVAEEISGNVRALNLPHARSSVGSFVTLSMGAACAVPKAGSDMNELIKKADAALYEAKRQGRARVVRAED